MTKAPTAADALAALALIHAVRRRDDSAVRAVWDSCDRLAMARCLVALVDHALAAPTQPLEGWLDGMTTPAISKSVGS